MLIFILKYITNLWGDPVLKYFFFCWLHLCFFWSHPCFEHKDRFSSDSTMLARTLSRIRHNKLFPRFRTKPYRLPNKGRVQWWYKLSLQFFFRAGKVIFARNRKSPLIILYGPSVTELPKINFCSQLEDWEQNIQLVNLYH